MVVDTHELFIGSDIKYTGSHSKHVHSKHLESVYRRHLSIKYIGIIFYIFKVLSHPAEWFDFIYVVFEDIFNFLDEEGIIFIEIEIRKRSFFHFYIRHILLNLQFIGN